MCDTHKAARPQTPTRRYGFGFKLFSLIEMEKLCTPPGLCGLFCVAPRGVNGRLVSLVLFFNSFKISEVALMNEVVGRRKCSLLRVCWNFTHCKIRCHSLAVAALTLFKAQRHLDLYTSRLPCSMFRTSPIGNRSVTRLFHSEINELGAASHTYRLAIDLQEYPTA